VAFIEVKPHVKGNSVAVELTDFSVFYSQDSIANAEATSRKGEQDRGREGPDRQGQQGQGRHRHPREQLTKKWTDWIDYWAVDFNFESKREIIRMKMAPGRRELPRGWTGAGNSKPLRSVDRRLHL
jgi:hypothetical protein